MRKDDLIKALGQTLKPMLNNKAFSPERQKFALDQVADACLRNFPNFDDKRFLNDPEFQKVLKMAFVAEALNMNNPAYKNDWIKLLCKKNTPEETDKAVTQLQKMFEQAKKLVYNNANPKQKKELDEMENQLTFLVTQIKQADALKRQAQAGNKAFVQLFAATMNFATAEDQDQQTKYLVDLFGIDPRQTGQQARYIPYVVGNYTPIIDQNTTLGLNAISQLSKDAPNAPAPTGKVAVPGQAFETPAQEEQSDAPQGITPPWMKTKPMPPGGQPPK